MTPQVHLLQVFSAGPHGGNPAPIVVDTAGMTDRDLQAVARVYGHESGFVLPTTCGSDCDFVFRFWVPNHEMEMCGHATVGAVWLLAELGRLPPRNRIRISTRSGIVEADVTKIDGTRRVEVSQPRGWVRPVPDATAMEAEIVAVLGITANELAPQPIRNACTSRVKTLVPLKSVAVLDELKPVLHRIEAVCERIGSTGLYPYAGSDLDDQVFDARQFPKASGYPEDAATGIAASALAFGLLENGQVEASNRLIRVRQGRAMGRPSEIEVRLDIDSGTAVRGCWIGGNVHFTAEADPILRR